MYVVWEMRARSDAKVSVMGSFILDLRYTLRTMRMNPGFVALAVFSLSIGIGINTAIYSIYGTIFQPDRGVRDVDQIVQISNAELSGFQGSYPEYLDYRGQTSEIFEDMMAYIPMIAVLDLGPRSEMIFLEEVSGNYFELLGVEPLFGRVFLEEDDSPGASPATVLSCDTWRRWYRSDPDIVGKVVKLNGNAFTVIGVAKDDFPGMFPFTCVLWTTIEQEKLINPNDSNLTSRTSHNAYMKGRLREGITLAQAREVLQAARTGIVEKYPDVYRNIGTGPVVVPARNVQIGPEVDQPIKMLSWFLMGLVGLVLVIACTNLAGILLARASARRREIGIRLAVGAGRSRLMRQLLTESVLLAVMGGMVGVFIAYGLINLLVAVRPPFPLPINLNFGIDGRALFFALILSIGTGIIFGLLPARHATNPNIIFALRGGSETFGSRPRRFGIKNSLVVAQVSVSAVLLLCAGLLIRSLTMASAVDPGFDLRRGAIVQFPFEFTSYDQVRARSFVRQAKARLSSIPGVEAVGVVKDLPLGLSYRSSNVLPIDSQSQVDDRGVVSSNSVAGPDFFKAMGIPLLRGRFFDDGDVQETERVAIVNQSFVQRFWPGADPIGRQFRFLNGGRVYTIVGVVADGKYRTLGEDQRLFFWRAAYQGILNDDILSIVVRSDLPAGQLITAIRNEITAIDPDMPIFELQTVSQYRGLMLFIPRLVGSIASVLGLVALLLGITGLYGVIAYDVSRRTREVGIRMALGAQKRDVLAQVLWSGMRLVLVGLLVGVPIAGLASQGLTALLFGISPLDPITFIGIPLLLIGITVAATLMPARQAARVNPVDALNHE